jgi:hypothetical protein
MGANLKWPAPILLLSRSRGRFFSQRKLIAKQLQDVLEELNRAVSFDVWEVGKRFTHAVQGKDNWDEPHGMELNESGKSLKNVIHLYLLDGCAQASLPVNWNYTKAEY